MSLERIIEEIAFSLIPLIILFVGFGSFTFLVLKLENYINKRRFNNQQKEK